MGMIGPEYEFLFADVGMNSRISDGGNWFQIPLKLALESGSLNLPDLHHSLDAQNQYHIYVQGTMLFLFLHS